MKLEFIMVCIIFFIIKPIFGQVNFPNVIPPSPETASLFYLKDNTINYSTGMINLNIPLYTIEVGGLKVPLSMSYNSSGRQVFEQTGPLGLGWSLDGIGSIARTVYGKPDDMVQFPSVIENTNNLSIKNDFDYLASLFYGYGSGNQGSHTSGSGWDSEYDVFSYYFGGNSGKFVYSGDRSQIHLIPAKPYKIQPGGYPSQIVDEFGTVYKFGKNEVASWSDPSVVTNKLITEIISPSGADTIKFSYQIFVKSSRRSRQDLVVVDDNTTGSNATWKTSSMNNYLMNYVTNEAKQYQVQRLKEISFRGGKVVFNLEGTTDRVSSISILNSANELVKRIVFQRSVLDINGSSTESHYKLDELKFEDKNGLTVQKYGFEYFSTQNHTTFSRDFWGYRNGTSQNYGVPNYSILFLDASGSTTYMNVGSGASRVSNAESQKGMLKKITYPTGGSTEYAYELNRVKVGTATVYSGGLRVRSIVNNSLDGGSFEKQIYYGQNENGFGDKQLKNITMEDLSYESRFFSSIERAYNSSFPSPDVTQSYRRRVFTSDFLPDLEVLAGSPTYYTEVVEYYGTKAINQGKVIYKYHSPIASNILSYYPSAVFPGYACADIGYCATFNYVQDQNLRRLHFSRINVWDDPHLISETKFKVDTSDPSGFSRVNEVINNYTTTITDVLKGIHFNKYLEFPYSSGGGNSNERFAATQFGLPVFVFANYDFILGKKELTSSISKEYDPSGQNPLTIDKFYVYNNKQLPKEVKQISSFSPTDTVITKYLYPMDFSTAIAVSMVGKNMLNFHLEELNYRNSTLLKGKRSNYKNWGGGLINIENVSTKMGSSPYEQRLLYKNFDGFNNIVELDKQGLPVSFIWGYNFQFPVVESVNATNSQISFSSFETTDKGGWTYSGAPNTTYYKTGKKGYNLSSGAVTKTGITASTSAPYRVGFWARTVSGTGSVNVGGQTEALTATWKWVEKTVTSSSLTISGTSVIIDELRLHPADAMMTSYTYEPLVGMTSKTDPRGYTVIYVYDAAGRLITVKDEDGYILEHYEYNYSTGN